MHIRLGKGCPGLEYRAVQTNRDGNLRREQRRDRVIPNVARLNDVHHCSRVVHAVRVSFGSGSWTQPIQHPWERYRFTHVR